MITFITPGGKGVQPTDASGVMKQGPDFPAGVRVAILSIRYFYYGPILDPHLLRVIVTPIGI